VWGCGQAWSRGWAESTAWDPWPDHGVGDRPYAGYEVGGVEDGLRTMDAESHWRRLVFRATKTVGHTLVCAHFKNAGTRTPETGLHPTCIVTAS
jgi:hypothetical protein